MSHIIATTDLAELIRPFVGAKLNRQRDPGCSFGGFLPRTAAIDIRHVSNSIDADVRSVGDRGIEIFFYDRCGLVGWADLQEVTLRSIDADGNTTASTTYVPQSLQVAA